jgi:hypothetical protein
MEGCTTYVSSVVSGANIYIFLSNSKASCTSYIKLYTAPSYAKYEPLKFGA